MTTAIETKDLIEKISSGFDAFTTKTNAQMEALRRDIERVEAKHNRAGLGGMGGGSELEARRARLSMSNAPEAERKAFRSFLTTGERRYLDAIPMESKAMSVGTPSDGGYACPIWFDAEVYSIARDATPMIDLVRRKEVGNFPSQHVVSLGGAASGWSGETGARAATGTPQITVVSPPGGDLWANPQVTQWALDDLFFNVEEYLAQEIGLTFGRSLEDAIVVGNGTNRPKGFLQYPTALTADASRAFGTLQHLVTGAAATLPTTTTAAVDLLLNTVHSLKPELRKGAVWAMTSATLAAMRGYKDTTGRPVLVDSLIAGQPSTLLGYPVVEVAAMPAIAANAFPIAFGNFNRGYVLDEHVSGLRVLSDPYTNKPYVGFYSLRRLAGDVLDSNAIKLIKCST